MDEETKLEFFLNGERKVIRDADPTRTVLDYVRSTGLTGTKLGCQEGGCGACTMTLSEWDEEKQRPHFYSVNGCIMPIIAVDGKHLITVEGIGNSAEPHAIQDRIGKLHGSQCGFCTPGIVMSLYSLVRETNGSPSREQISEAFDGNLCRCTGYKPIIDAANSFAKDGGSDTCCKGDQSNGCCKGNQSNGCCKTNPVSIQGTRTYPHAELIFPPMLKRFKKKLLRLQDETGKVWYRPTNLNELVHTYRHFPNAKLVGGASEFQIEAKIRGDEHPVCIYVGDVPELRSFEYIKDKGIRIGGDIPLTELELRLEELVSKLPDSKTQFYKAILAQLKFFAGRQIRNVATPAGNIATASPISDLNPVFVSANVNLEVLNPDTGEVNKISMGNYDEPFFIGYRKTLLGNNLLLTHIEIPESSHGDVARTYKQAKRKDDDISIVTACLYARADNGKIKDARFAFGGVAPFTVLAKTSKKLIGEPLTALRENFEQYMEDLANEFNLPYDVPGGMATFRRSLVLSFFYKFVQSLLSEAGGGFYDKDALIDVTRTVYPVGVRDLQEDNPDDVIGNKVVHVNAMRQVTGEAVYVDDMPQMTRELFGVQVMSTKARAKVLSVDYTDALEMEGVVGKIDLDDVPGSNRWGIYQDIGPERLFVENMAEYVGDTVAVILATSKKTAEAAARKVKVTYEEDPEGPVVTIENAIERNSFFEIGNKVERGDFSKLWESSDLRFEGECRMGAQEHFYLEPQGCLVVPEDGGMEYKIYASSQNPNETQLVAASALGIPASRIVARVKRLGGGFGGKETRSIHVSTLASLAAKKFNVPVRMILSRSEDMIQSGQRHPFLTKWRVVLDSSLKFKGLEAKLYANAGYSMDLTKGVIDRATLHVDNCYDFGDHISIQAKACRTNLASNTAFRGFGGPQGMFVAESIIYEISERLNLSDPEILRQRNYYPMDGTGRTHYLQWLGEDFTVPLMSSRLREKVNYQKIEKEVREFNSKSKWLKRGLACVPTKFGVAFGVQFLNQGGALVHIYEDGSVLLTHGGTEMGQGLHTKMIMVCASELGVPIESVFISETSTNTVANASPTAASASSDINGMAIKDACDKLNARLKPYRDRLGPGASMKEIAHAAYLDRVNLSANGFYKMPDVGYTFDNSDPNPKPAFQYYTQGVAVTLVEVDTLTGDWANLSTDIMMDIGRPLNEAIDYGQIEGAFIQGQGLFTIEESLWTAKGAILTRGPGAYKIPGFRDMPQRFNVEYLRDREFKHLKTIRRSKGVGEPPLFLGSAVLFAIRDAIKQAKEEHGASGLVPFESPFTSELIRVSVGDSILAKAVVKKIGTPFSVRA